MDNETKMENSMKNRRLETELTALYIMARKWKDDTALANIIYTLLEPLMEKENDNRD